MPRHTSLSRRLASGAQCTRYCTRVSHQTAKMKLAVCILLAANGALALTPPKSAVAATRTGTALETAAPIAAKEVAGLPRGGVIANFVGVDVALLSYFFFWYLGNYYCPRPRPKQKLRGAMDSVVRHRREFEKTHTPASQTTSRTSSPSRTRAAPRASP